MSRLLGVDLSKWQVSWTPTAKTQFAIMRSGYGRMPDKLFETFYDAAYLGGVPRGAYHYFSSAVPWKEQVDFFLKQTDGKSFSKFALDIETAYNNMSRDFALCAVKWIDTIHRETGVETLLYTSPYIYRDNLRAHTAEVDRIKLWIAQYPSRTWSSFVQNIAEKFTGEPWLKPTGRADWSIWQFTDKAPGASWGVGSNSVDLDILNAGEEFISDSPVEPEPEDVHIRFDEIQGDYKVTVNIDVEKI